MLEIIIGTPIVDIGCGSGDITVTLTLIVDGVSLVVVGYSRGARTSHHVGFVSFHQFTLSYGLSYYFYYIIV